jgi:hypothetical protein
MLKMTLVQGTGLMRDWVERRWFNIVGMDARMVITRAPHPARSRRHSIARIVRAL